ncbi:MAG TPA: tetratricopeptide repeat protein [Herpetosiphonaceae bacterium]|nr:tetratricopeptide repeat protein [Herpetosiphonaceae bacterium]
MRTKRSRLIDRPRLLEHSQIGHEAPPRAVLLLGLAGSGKSVALDQIAAASPAPAIAVSLPPAGAAAGFDPAALGERLAGLAAPHGLAVDDFQHGLDERGAPLPQTLAWLDPALANPAVTILAASRVAPEWPPLARLALRDDLVIIDANQLAFTDDEAAELWRLHQEGAPDPAALGRATHGWAALTELVCRQGWPPDPALASLLIDDALATLPPDQLPNLQALAWLDGLTPALVGALSGTGDAVRQIQAWQRLGIVRRQQSPAIAPHLRAALQGQADPHAPAYAQALAELAGHYGAGGDWAALAELTRRTRHWPLLIDELDRHGGALFDAGRYADVVAWLAEVPSPSLTVRAGSLLARCYIGLNDRDGAILTLNRLLGTHIDPISQRTLYVLKANMYQASGDIAAADALVAPYLEDGGLPPDDRARILRIHGIALASQGRDDPALDCFERAAAQIEHQAASRLVGLVLGDYANVAARVGRYRLAERLLRRAERVWRDLSDPPPPDLATTLNMQAVVALQTGRMDEAARLADHALEHARATGRPRAVIGATATRGDIAMVRHEWQAAAEHYRQANDEAYATGDLTLQPYILAMCAQAARLSDSLPLLHSVLRSIESIQATAALDQAWFVVGKAAAFIHLGLPGAAEMLQQTLDSLGDKPTLPHGMLLLMLAEARWRAGDQAGAARAWARLDQLLVDGRGGVPLLLEPLADHAGDLLVTARTQWRSAFAARLAGAGQPADRPTPRLALRVLGEQRVQWQGADVERFPRNGLLALTLLVLSGGAGMTGEELRERIWGDGDGSLAAWRKTLERVRQRMPGVIVLDGATYRIGLPLEQIDADISLVLNTPLAGGDPAALRQAAEYAARPLLAGIDEPWVLGERQRLLRRGAELWFALGAFEQDEHNLDAAGAAYATALALHPLHERAVIAAMSLALRQARRHEAIEIYRAYSQRSLAELGLDPGPEIEGLYRRALEG